MPSRGGPAKLKRLIAQEDDFYAEMVGAVETARRNVADLIAKSARNPKAVAQAAVRQKLYGSIDGVYSVMAKELDKLARDLTNAAGKDWHKAALKDIKDATGGAGPVRFDRERLLRYWEIIHPDNADQLAGTFAGKLAGQDVQDLRKAFVETWRQGEVEGLTLNQRHKLLQQKWDAAAGDMATHRFVDRAGTQWSNARYLEMLSRTTMQRVSRESYLDTLAANQDDLVMVRNVDGEACLICQAWDGVILSISGSSQKYPSYAKAEAAGLFHPNCRCMSERVDETIDAEQVKTQAEKRTPPLDPKPDETPTEFRNRVTKAVTEYSLDFEKGEPGV